MSVAYIPTHDAYIVCHIAYPNTLLTIENTKQEAIVSLALASAYRSQSMMVNLLRVKRRRADEWGKKGIGKMMRSIGHLSTRPVVDDIGPLPFE